VHARLVFQVYENVSRKAAATEVAVADNAKAVRFLRSRVINPENLKSGMVSGLPRSGLQEITPVKLS
jgi:hypothetical protein